MSIDLRNLTRRFGPQVALDDVSLRVKPGELVGLLGPSGSGKTTLLRIIAGLDVPDEGEVYLDGADATRQRAQHRRVGFVFQHYALFRHLTIFENIAFGLRVRARRDRPPEASIRTRVRDLLQLVQLEALADRLPAQLSGGQRQRVALARALAVEPRVLLLDEPFGALDARVRKELRRWLRRLHDELKVTSVFVTHDQDEALELSDRVVIMNHGRVEQDGSPEQVYHHPASPFVYRFLGDMNLFHGRVEGGKAYVGDVALDLPSHVSAPAGDARVYIRPHLLGIELHPNGGAHFPATVTHINPAGALVRVDLMTEWGDDVRVDLSQERFRALALRPTHRVFLAPQAEDWFVETA